MRSTTNVRLAAWAAAILLPAAGLGLPARAAGPCSQTAAAALRACSHEVRDDYWIAIGNCANLPAEERSACRDEAKDERQAGGEECAEQNDARLEVCEDLGEDAYHPQIDPADFLDVGGIIANPNPYFPLVPGTTYVFAGGDETDTVSITHETREILGVTTIVVHDVVSVGGEAIEDTEDFYGQDLEGNVWYFGEISQEFEDGELVSLEGSWQAGRGAGKPGIIMQAAPELEQVYRQEFDLGNAEDVAEVLMLTGSAIVPAASCDGDCLVTLDYTPISPGAEEHKYYAPGVGLILEVDPLTGDRVELVEIIVE